MSDVGWDLPPPWCQVGTLVRLKSRIYHATGRLAAGRVGMVVRAHANWETADVQIGNERVGVHQYEVEIVGKKV